MWNRRATFYQKDEKIEIALLIMYGKFPNHFFHYTGVGAIQPQSLQQEQTGSPSGWYKFSLQPSLLAVQLLDNLFVWLFDLDMILVLAEIQSKLWMRSKEKI